MPESSKLDLDAEQSKQTMQILSGLLGSKDIDTMYDSARQGEAQAQAAPHATAFYRGRGAPARTGG